MHPICYFISFLLLTISNAEEIYKLETIETLYSFNVDSTNTTTLYFAFDTLKFGGNAQLLISFNYPNITSIGGKAYKEAEMENIKNETSFTYTDYLHIDNNYLFPFKSNVFSEKNMFCIKVTLAEGNTNSFTAALTYSDETYITQRIHEEFTYDEGVPKIFIYRFEGVEDKKGLLFLSSKEQMNLFTEDLFSKTLPSFIQTNIRGYYKESETGFNVFTIVFVSKGEKIELDVNINDKKIETSTSENKEQEAIQNIEIKNAYQPFYLIDTFAENNEGYYVYFNLHDNKHVKIYHKDNIEGSVDNMLDEGFVPVENGFVASTTKYDIFKIECAMRCEIEMAYIDDITDKTFKINEMFIAVVKKNKPLIYTYTDVQDNDQYEFQLMNDKEVSITIGEAEILLNSFKTYELNSLIGVGDEGSISFKLETTNDYDEVLVKGKIARNSSFKLFKLEDMNPITITSGESERLENIIIEMPNGKYDSMHLSLENKDLNSHLNFTYEIYSSNYKLPHIPYKKPGEPVQIFVKSEFEIYNPYYMVMNEENVNEDKKLSLVIHVESDSALAYELSVQFLITNNQDLYNNFGTQIYQNGAYRLEKPPQDTDKILIIVSRCTFTSPQVSLQFYNDGTKLKQINATDLMEYYIFEHKNYIFDVDIQVENENSTEQINFFYTFISEDIQFNRNRALNQVVTNDTVELTWESPMLNSDQIFVYKIYLSKVNDGEQTDLCNIIELINDNEYHFVTNSTENEVTYTMNVNQMRTNTINNTNTTTITTSYIGVVVGRQVGINELNVNFIYEPITFNITSSGDVPTPDPTSNSTLLIVIIVVIVVLILVIVWIIVKGKRRNNVVESLPEKDRPLV